MAPWSVISHDEFSRICLKRYSFDGARKCCFSYFFQFPLEFPDAVNNKDQNRCSSSNRLSATLKILPFLCATMLERIAKSKKIIRKLWRIWWEADISERWKMTGNFIKNSTKKKVWSTRRFHFSRFPSDDGTGRKLTGKDLQIDGINQHD